MKNNPNSTFRIFLVATEIHREPGGIQYVNRLLLRAFADFSQRVPCEVEVFSLNDLPQLPSGNGLRARGMAWHGCDRQRMKLAARLATRLARVQPHVVLFTHVNLMPMAAAVRTLSPNAVVAMLGHGVEVWQEVRGAAGRELRRANAIVAPSQFTREKLIQVNGVQAERISVLPHGLPNEGIDERVVSRREGRTLLSVTRLIAEDSAKGVDKVIRAMPRIRERCPVARFVIVGDGSDRQRLESLRDELELRACVEFRGTLQEAALREAYHEADVFVLPSQTEGFGIVFVEAMSHGLPVVAASAVATPEVVLDGETGILVPPEEPAQLASAVSGLLLLGEERARMGAAGQQRVRENYLYSQFAARWHRWLATVAPEPIYMAKHTATFANFEEVEAYKQ